MKIIKILTFIFAVSLNLVGSAHAAGPALITSFEEAAHNAAQALRARQPAAQGSSLAEENARVAARTAEQDRTMAQLKSAREFNKLQDQIDSFRRASAIAQARRANAIAQTTTGVDGTKGYLADALANQRPVVRTAPAGEVNEANELP